MKFPISPVDMKFDISESLTIHFFTYPVENIEPNVGCGSILYRLGVKRPMKYQISCPHAAPMGNFIAHPV